MFEKTDARRSLVSNRASRGCGSAGRRAARQRRRVRSTVGWLLLSFTSSFFFLSERINASEPVDEVAPAAPGATAPTPADLELLEASDLFSAAPEEFRAEVEVRQGAATAGMPLEIWRRGEGLALIRLLAEKDRGKFLLRRDRELYFISPGSSRPVMLAPSYRLQGAALDDLLGLRLMRDYRIERVAEKSGVVTFDLVASDKSAAAPRLRWVVSRARRLPLRADLQTAEGKVLRVLEFGDWRDAKRGVPGRLTVKEVLRGGAPIEIRFTDFESRAVDPALFDLEHGASRAALPVPKAP